MAAVLAIAVCTIVSAHESQGANEKSIYVVVTDAQTNKPVSGLPAAAFAVREDNQDREVIRVAPATEPMAVVFLADTTSAFVPHQQDLRSSSAAFIKKFLAGSPKSPIALWEFGGADIPVENFTTDSAKLEQATTKLFAKGTISGVDTSGSAVLRGQNIISSNLLEAIVSGSKQLAKRPETRRVIVSFNDDVSVEGSKMPGQQVQDEVTKGGVTLMAVSLQSTATNGPLRDNVLDQLCPFSGGRRITINGVQALAATLENVADVINSQYIVTYARPSGSAKQVLVGAKVQGVKMSTPRWAPK